jgi:hypothetical protein
MNLADDHKNELSKESEIPSAEDEVVAMISITN